MKNINFKKYFELFWLDPVKEKPVSLAKAMPTYTTKGDVIIKKKKEPNKMFGIKDKISQ